MVAAVLSFASLVLLAIAMATNYWVRFDDTDTDVIQALNPITTNSEFDGLILRYRLEYFGLWIGCHNEIEKRKISCGYIGASCYSNVCWIRNGRDDDRACEDARVKPVTSCASYQATRAMVIIGTLFLIAGSAITVVCVFVGASNLISTGALATFLGGLFVMIGFAVFYDNIFRPIDDIASIGWSFILLIVSWPLAVLAAILAFLSPMLGSKEEEEYDQVDLDEKNEA